MPGSAGRGPRAVLDDRAKIGTGQGGALIATAGFVLLATAFSARYGAIPGPEIEPFLPISATVWALAEALTAFLLFARFWATGRLGFGIIGVAYALCSMLTVPYLLFFPQVFQTGRQSLGDQQISIYLWSAWHILFPLLVALGMMVEERSRGQIVRARGFMAVLMVAGSAVLAALVSGLVYAGRSALPPMVDVGRLLPNFTHIGAPAIALANALACIYVWRLVRPVSTLQAALVVALLTSACDAFLNAFSASRYSYAWYVGKAESILTASVVLFMLLIELVILYRRLRESASVDALTGLANRRSFDEQFGWTLGNTRRRAANIALLMIDIDHFKKLNDRFGHSAGDEYLRAVGAVLRSSLARAQDLVARYGGEEFVVVLPDTPLEGVRVVAEKIRAGIAALDVCHSSTALEKITISIGGAFSTSSALDARALFDAADWAMYDAKQRGRDRVVLRELRDEHMRVPAFANS
jgi:diguanylate cyclase (GGDEF)-like protein